MSAILCHLNPLLQLSKSNSLVLGSELTVPSVIAMAPLIATFILFDFVVYNPTHPATQRNQALLEVIAGYFTRLDLVSSGSFRGIMIAKLTSIARGQLTSISITNGQRTIQNIMQGTGTDSRYNLTHDWNEPLQEFESSVSRPGPSASDADQESQIVSECLPSSPRSADYLETLGTSFDFAGPSPGDSLQYPIEEDWTAFDNPFDEIRVIDLFTQGLE